MGDAIFATLQIILNFYSQENLDSLDLTWTHGSDYVAKFAVPSPHE